VRGCVDRNLLGQAFYHGNERELRKLKMSCLVRGNRIIDHPTLCRTTGIEFTPASYLLLVTAGKFALEKYANKNGSNGTSLPLAWLMQRFKKGSRKFRLIIESSTGSDNPISKLRVVNTFFRLIECNIPDPKELGILYGSWNWSFLSNQVRTFIFQFLNNSLSMGARIAARYRNGGQIVDERCTFCVKARTLVPGREDFYHLFYSCVSVMRLRENVCRELFPHTTEPAMLRLTCFTGLIQVRNNVDRFFMPYQPSSLILLYGSASKKEQYQAH
jgi:hypothetical protein